MSGGQVLHHSVFVTGATGYIGSRTVTALVARGHHLFALVRRPLPADGLGNAILVTGNALDRMTYRESVKGCDTFIHLVGVAHPDPSKAREFKEIDLVGTKEAIDSAREAGCKHFIYVSVAHPSPVMKAFVETRIACEELLIKSGLAATILRPWYVLGPGHRWPCLLIPFYLVARIVPQTRQAAVRLGLVTIHQMVDAIVQAVEHPPDGVRIVEVQGIRGMPSRLDS